MSVALTFHRITNKENLTYEDISIEKFTFILNEIHDLCLSLEQINNRDYKDNFWLLTFDDGFSSDVDIVLPLLKKYKISAIFFITTAFVGMPNYMTWEQIRYLSDCGMVIGSHSVNHSDMKSMTKSERITEFETSCSIIEAQISKKVKMFSFPYGRFNSSIANEAFEAGYEYCFTSIPGVLNKNDKIIPRISLNGKTSKEEIFKLLDQKNNHYQKQLLLYYIKDFAKNSIGMKNYWQIRNLFT